MTKHKTREEISSPSCLISLATSSLQSLFRILLNMSLTYSLLLFLLCLPLHACNARPLGVIGDKLEKRFLLPKNDEKLSPVKIPVALKPSSSSRVVGGDLKLIGSKAKKLKAPEAKKPKDHETKISGASQTYELPSSVSWNMPHGKRGEEHPGFDLDYLPPRTHPPVHN